VPIALNTEMLAHAYDYLCCQKPFSAWNLPHSEDVKFLVIRSADRYAHYQMVGGVHHIAVSTKFVGRHEVLIATVAHELIHLHCRAARIPMRNPHGRAFQKLADEVCKLHDFDRLTF
jgi:hypothetical protein